MTFFVSLLKNFKLEAHNLLCVLFKTKFVQNFINLFIRLHLMKQNSKSNSKPEPYYEVAFSLHRVFINLVKNMTVQYVKEMHVDLLSFFQEL